MRPHAQRRTCNHLRKDSVKADTTRNRHSVWIRVSGLEPLQKYFWNFPYSISSSESQSLKISEPMYVILMRGRDWGWRKPGPWLKRTQCCRLVSQSLMLTMSLWLQGRTSPFKFLQLTCNMLMTHTVQRAGRDLQASPRVFAHVEMNVDSGGGGGSIRLSKWRRSAARLEMPFVIRQIHLDCNESTSISVTFLKRIPLRWQLSQLSTVTNKNDCNADIMAAHHVCSLANARQSCRLFKLWPHPKSRECWGDRLYAIIFTFDFVTWVAT